MYRNDCVVCLVVNTVFKISFKKGIFFSKFPFYIRRSVEISGMGVLHFQETPSLIGNQTNHRANMLLSY